MSNSTHVFLHRYYEEYQWLVDFSVYALLVYGCTEAYIYFFPSRAAQELNLSMVSCLLVAGSAYKVMTNDIFLHHRYNLPYPL